MKSPKPPQQEYVDPRTPEAKEAEAASTQAYKAYLARMEALRANPAAAEADFMSRFSNIFQPGYDFMRTQSKEDAANVAADLGWGMKRVGPQHAGLSRRYGDIARMQGEEKTGQRFNYYSNLQTAGIPGAPPIPGYQPQGKYLNQPGGPSPFSQIFNPLMSAVGTAAGGYLGGR